MRLAPWLLALGACGRVSFEPRGDASSDALASDGTPDAALTLADGIVAYYPMDTVGSSLVDASPNHLDGTCVGASACSNATTGIIGGANMFTMAAAFHVPDAPQLHLTVFTVAAWVNPAVECSMFSKAQAAGAGASFELAIFAGDTQFCTDSNPGATGEDCLSSNVGLPVGTWTHVAFVYDGAMKRLYQDGIEMASDVALPPVFDATPFVIGSDEENGVDKGYAANGSIDELRIYNRAFSSADVVMLRDLR